MESCTGARELLAQAAYEKLEPAVRAELDRHLAACADCRREGDGLARTVAVIGRPAGALDPADRALLKNRVLARLRPRRFTVRPRSPLLAWSAAAAAAILLGAWLLAPRRDPVKVEAPSEVARETPTVEPAPDLPWPTAPESEPPRPPLEAVPLTPPPAPPVEPPAPEPVPEPPPSPDPVKPRPPAPKPPGTREAPPVEVALTLESGRVRDIKGSGPGVFTTGQAIRTQTACRISWAGATLYMKEGTSFTITAKEALQLDAGAVLIENFGGKFAVQTSVATFREDGTRFMVSAGAQVEAIVYEGRLDCELSGQPRKLKAGERATVGRSGMTVEAVKNLAAYPSWTSSSLAPRVPLYTLNFQGREWTKQILAGSVKGGALHAARWGDGCYLGIENDPTRPILALPARGEVWVTYFTMTEDPITLRLRAPIPDSIAFDVVIERPVPKRWVPVRAPLSKFRSFEGKPLQPGYPVHIIYLSSRDPNLSMADIAVLEIK